MQGLRHGFKALGDFAQRLYAIATVSAVLVSALIVGYGWIFDRFSLETRARTFSVLSVFLIVLVLVELMCILRLMAHRESTSKVDGRLGDNADGLTPLHEKRWRSLEGSYRGFDFYFAHILRRTDITVAEKRWRAIEKILGGRRDTILRSVEPQKIRFAFLEFNADTGRFKVINSYGLEPQSIVDIERGLSRDIGIAGRVIQKERDALGVKDVDSDEAKALGWVNISTEPRHKSLVCVSVWVDKEPISVLSVDCVEKHAFGSSPRSSVNVLQARSSR